MDENNSPKRALLSKIKLINLKPVCAVLTILLIALGIISISAVSNQNELKDSYEQTQSDLNSLQNTFKDLQTQFNNNTKQLSDVKIRISEKEAENEKLSEDLETANTKIAELSKIEDQQATIDQLNAQIADYKNQIESLQAQVSDLQSQLSEAQSKAVQTGAVGKGSFKPFNNESNNNNSNNEETVYWVSNGEVYHSTSDCSTLKRSKNIHSGTISQSGKSRPCKVCH